MRNALSMLLWCAMLYPFALALAQTPRSIRLAAEEWPPFVTTELPEDGLSGTLVHATFERLGYKARIDYFPWRRAMELGLRDGRYAGVVVVYRTPEREAQCHFSAPVATANMVLAYLKDQPVRASRLAALRGIRIGTVAGYSNGEEFDTLARQRQLDVEEGPNDETNVRKLLARRFPAIVIERRVLNYLLATRFTPEERERIASDPRLFDERTMHICFKRSPEGLLQQRAFNEAARTLDYHRLERDYLRRIGQLAEN